MTADKIILYDDNCPLCCWYTSAFVKTGLLTKKGRQAFADINPDAIAQRLDIERSKDEIPLLDPQGGTTLYGVESLLYLLGQRWPWMVRIAGWTPINWFLQRLYKFISYNRRVIVASKTPAGRFDCSPQFNYLYRILYLVFALMIGGVGLLNFLSKLTSGYYSYLLPIGLLLMIFLPAIHLVGKQAKLHYAGIMVTPLLVLGLWLETSTILSLPSWVGGCIALMLTVRMWIRRYNLALEF